MVGRRGVRAVITLPWCFAKGMFWDLGVVYGSRRKNLSHGIGDFWHPQVTATFMHRFHEHPPLAFWLQSLLFRVVDETFGRTRVRSVDRDRGLARFDRHLVLFLGCCDVPSVTGFGWLALAIWVPWGTWCVGATTCSKTRWEYSRRWRSMLRGRLESPRRTIAWSLLAGLAITAAVLTKGPVGLFPAATPLLGLCLLLSVIRGPRARSSCN